jgi:flagellar motor switch protein FliN
MKTYLDCWIATARALCAQALAGGPELLDSDETGAVPSGPAFIAEFTGDMSGRFVVSLESRILETPLLGEGVDQASGWAELFHEIAEGAAGELHATSGLNCRINSFVTGNWNGVPSRVYRLTSPGTSWHLWIKDELRSVNRETSLAAPEEVGSSPVQHSSGVDLLLDVELEAALRFGCCEMPLGEILELGPGDVVELDRHISEPVDLVVGDKIVARGEVVLVNGNFGLRVTALAEPQMRLESIRCLF